MLSLCLEWEGIHFRERIVFYTSLKRYHHGNAPYHGFRRDIVLTLKYPRVRRIWGMWSSVGHQSLPSREGWVRGVDTAFKLPGCDMT